MQRFHKCMWWLVGKACNQGESLIPNNACIQTPTMPDGTFLCHKRKKSCTFLQVPWPHNPSLFHKNRDREMKKEIKKKK